MPEQRPEITPPAEPRVTPPVEPRVPGTPPENDDGALGCPAGELDFVPPGLEAPTAEPVPLPTGVLQKTANIFILGWFLLVQRSRIRCAAPLRWLSKTHAFYWQGIFIRVRREQPFGPRGQRL